MTSDLFESLTTMDRHGWIFAAIGLSIALNPGCGKRNAYVAPPPPEVIVATPIVRTVTLYHEFPGTTQASQSVSIIPRVLGYIFSLHFTDGSFVSEGQLLFVIDPRPYQDAYDVAVAQVNVNEAAYKLAQANNSRAMEVSKTPGAISKQDLDMYKAQQEQAKANLELAKANQANAKLNLDFTHITAPISGKISRRLVDVGNLVSANTTVLTTINQFEPMYAYFNPSEADYLDYLKRQREIEAEAKGNTDKANPANPPKPKTPAPPTSKPATDKQTDPLQTDAKQTEPKQTEPEPGAEHHPVEMGLSDETGYPHKGFIDFVDNRVDPATGTISVRGVFPNPQPYRLAPGLFVRIRVPIGTQANALLVPDRALGTDQQGKYLLIVGSDDKVVHRVVQTGTLEEGNLRVINSGLKPGEQVIIEGLQFARAGSNVKPVTQSAAKESDGQTQQPNQTQTQGRPPT